MVSRERGGLDEQRGDFPVGVQRGEQRRLIALVTQGYENGGGVPTVAQWLKEGLDSSGKYSVDIHDLATSRSDSASRRIAAPGTWLQRSLRGAYDANSNVQHWGANAVEIEISRYRPRAELTEILAGYDIIQVVAGTSALGAAALLAKRPIVLQIATRAAWERESQLVAGKGTARLWRRFMASRTAAVELEGLRGACAVLVENRDMLDYVRSTGQNQVILAPPGVDTNRFKPHPDGWQKQGYLLSVCRLSDARKGLDRLICAYRSALDYDDRTPNLVLAGRGKLPFKLIALIDDLELTSRITVLSDVRAVELPRLYQGASAYLQASHEEGLGISVLEAMAAGLPVVATDTAGSRETVVDGETGWVVPQTPTRLVAAAIANCIVATLGTTGASMGALARQRCTAMYSVEATLTHFIEEYDKLLGVTPRCQSS